MYSQFIRLIFSIFLFFTIAGSPAIACDVSFENISRPVFESYSATARQVEPQKITLRLRNDADENCFGAIRIDALDGDGHLLGQNGQRMSYGLFSARDSSQILFQAGSKIENRISMNVPADGSRDVDLYLAIDRLQDLPAGTYMTDLNFDFVTQSLDVLDTMVLRIGSDINPSLQANFTGLASPLISNNETGSNSNRQHAVLNLGEITPNETQRLGLQIRANAPVTIQVNSENKGVLLHEFDEGEIQYTTKLNDRDLDLTTTTRLNGYASPNRNGVTNPLIITVSDFGKNVPAGNYYDVLTFQISAR